MSTRTIAIDSRVYDRLAFLKREGESFSKLIDRLLTEVRAAHTGNDILQGLLAGVAPLPYEESQVFLRIVAENRAHEWWDNGDLR